MKKIYLLSLFASAFSLNATAQTFWSDDFEDTGSPSVGTRTTSVAEFKCTSGFFKRTNGSDITWSNAFTGYTNTKYFGAMDIDRGPSCGSNGTIPALQTITWSGINIAGKTGITFKGLFGANSGAIFQGKYFDDASQGFVMDYIVVEYRIDGGTWSKALGIYPNDGTAAGGPMALDQDNDKIGDGTPLTNAMTELAGTISGTGSSLDLRVSMFINNSNPGAVAFDNLRLSTTATNTAPTATNVAHTGTLKEGQTLTGTYTYADAESNGESGSTFKWYRSDNASGLNKTAIVSATSTSYVLTASDVSKYISFEVTPRDGALNGTAVESPLRGPIAPITLPVGIKIFNASTNGTHVILTWTTASERDNRKFIVYRSGDDMVFGAIGNVNGSGNSSVAKSYAYTDKMPIRGDNYYRLAQVDIDGTERVLETTSISFAIARPAVSVYPNPISTTATVLFKAGNYATARLLDNNGKMLRIFAITEGSSALNIDLSGFASGAYSLLLLGKGESNAVKLIKK